jgi:lipoprotein-releasing system permease protein
MKLILSLAFSHLWGRRRQTITSLLGVAVGVGFFIALSGLMQGFQGLFIQKIIDVSPHIIIKDEFRKPPKQPVDTLYKDGALDLSGLKPKEEKRGIRNAERILAQLDDMAGINATASLQGQGFLTYGSKTISSTIVGIDPEQEKKVSTLEEDMSDGVLENLLLNSNGIILGIGLVEKLGTAMGKHITIVSSEGVILKMKVVGIYNTGITSLDNKTSYVLLKKSQILQDRINIINEIRMRIVDVSRTQELAESIEQRFGYRTEAWQETNNNVLNLFVIQNGVTYSTIIAILIVSCFGIFNIISTVVLEKSRDIAILKSIGFLEWDIQRIFIIEGLVIGIFGTLIGWALGYGLCVALEQVPISMKEGGFIRFEGFTILYSAKYYMYAAIFAILSSGFAAYLPSRKAASLKPVDIIRSAA